MEDAGNLEAVVKSGADYRSDVVPKSHRQRQNRWRWLSCFRLEKGGCTAITFTIEFSEEQAATLKAQAAAQGLTVEEWLRQLADRQTDPASIADLQRTDPQEWARQFRSWADSHDANLPVLSDAAMSRDSIYPDRL